MMETVLRTGVVQKIMNGEETKFLPQYVIDLMRASKPLQELVRAVARNGSSAYDDHSDEDGKDEANVAQSCDQASTQPIGTELLKAFEDALSQTPAGTPAGNKRAKCGDGTRISVSQILKAQMESTGSADIQVHNKTLRIHAGTFFGLLLEVEGREVRREYACVTECFSYKKVKYVRLEIYNKTPKLGTKANVSPKLRELNFPQLKRYPTRKFTICTADQLKYPLHVLHACPRKSCHQSFGIGIQGGGDHDVAKYPLYVLNTFHVGSVNF